MSIKLHRAFHLRSKGSPLTADQVRAYAPAVFHNEAGSTTLSPYQHLNTAQVLAQLMSMGWGISEVAQTGAHRELAQLEAKHLVRLRREEDFGKEKGEVIPEIVVVNAHNASSKLHLYAGLWRIICANGLMAGTTIGQLSFYHHARVLQQIQEGVTRIAEDMVPAMLAHSKAMRQRSLTPKEALEFASAAYALRWATPVPSAMPADLLNVQRSGDAANDAWHVFNRVQENLIHGNFQARNNRRTVGPVTAVNNVVSINRDLWDLAARMVA